MSHAIAGFTRSFGNFLGVSPKRAKDPAPAPTVPTADTTAADAAAAEDDERKRAAAYGKSSTVLNGGAGLSDLGATSSSQLLGS